MTEPQLIGGDEPQNTGRRNTMTLERALAIGRQAEEEVKRFVRAIKQLQLSHAVRLTIDDDGNMAVERLPRWNSSREKND